MTTKINPNELKRIAESGGTGMGEYLLNVASAWEADRAALERARALAGQMQGYAAGMEEELNPSGVVVVAIVRAFGDKIAAALGEGGRP